MIPQYIGRFDNETKLRQSTPVPGALALVWGDDHTVYLFRKDKAWVSFPRSGLSSETEKLLPASIPGIPAGSCTSMASRGTRFIGSFDKIGDLPTGEPGDFGIVGDDSYICIEPNRWDRRVVEPEPEEIPLLATEETLPFKLPADPKPTPFEVAMNELAEKE